jgi:cell division protein FtsQ
VVTGNVLTSEEAVRSAVALEPGTNLVGIGTGPIVDRLLAIPSIADATVDVGLPDVVQVRVEERQAVVLWAIGDRRVAVDATGFIFADVTGDTTGAVAATPVVRDERAASTGLAVGARLDPTDLDAATRLGSLRPNQIGSQARSLGLQITDERGFVVTSGSGGWQAVFGRYGRSQRTPALIPGQIQLLAALLSGREATVQTVILADDREGTYQPKPTPRPTPTPRPSRAP